MISLVRLPFEGVVSRVLTTGPDAEFTALVQRQSRFVFQVAYAVLLNSHDAEDAVQETFLKLYRNRGWQHVDNERAFLARVAWRVAGCDHNAAHPHRRLDPRSARFRRNGLFRIRPGPEEKHVRSQSAGDGARPGRFAAGGAPCDARALRV